MLINMLKSKIHRATVTEANLDYVGSITIDETLMRAAGLFEYEQVCVANLRNGERLETYVIAGEADSGIICMNGAASHMAGYGDKVIIMAYAQMTKDDALAPTFAPKVVFVDDHNKVTRVARYEKHGALQDLPSSFEDAMRKNEE